MKSCIYVFVFRRKVRVNLGKIKVFRNLSVKMYGFNGNRTEHEIASNPHGDFMRSPQLGHFTCLLLLCQLASQLVSQLLSLLTYQAVARVLLACSLAGRLSSYGGTAFPTSLIINFQQCVAGQAIQQGSRQERCSHPSLAMHSQQCLLAYIYSVWRLQWYGGTCQLSWYMVQGSARLATQLAIGSHVTRSQTRRRCIQQGSTTATPQIQGRLDR